MGDRGRGVVGDERGYVVDAVGFDSMGVPLGMAAEMLRDVSSPRSSMAAADHEGRYRGPLASVDAA